jgi:hypothetical protein
MLIRQDSPLVLSHHLFKKMSSHLFLPCLRDAIETQPAGDGHPLEVNYIEDPSPDDDDQDADSKSRVGVPETQQVIDSIAGAGVVGSTMKGVTLIEGKAGVVSGRRSLRGWWWWWWSEGGI